MCCTEAPGLHSGERSFVCIHAEYICNPAPVDNESVRLHPIETPKEDSRISPMPCPAIQHNNLKKLRVVKPLIAAVIRVGVMCGPPIYVTQQDRNISRRLPHSAATRPPPLSDLPMLRAFILTEPGLVRTDLSLRCVGYLYATAAKAITS